MSVDVQNWARLSSIGVLLVVMGMVMTFGATWISYRFFDQNSVIKYALKLGGILLCVLGFMLAAEMYRV